MKDPAVLFYFQDFLVGTEFMTDEETGKYIRILCHQADKGALSKVQLKRICNGEVPEAIMDKLKVDENGNYYQQRMRIEKEKREKHCEHQRENANKRWNKDVCDGNATAMPLLNENINININEDINIKKRCVFKIPSIEEVKSYCEERKNNVNITRWYNFYEAKGWMIGKNKMKDWKAAVRTWENNETKTEDKFDKLERLKEEAYGKR